MRWVSVLCLTCVLAVLAVRTHVYAQAWRSELSLWQTAVLEAPYKPRPWVNYGAALAQRGRWDEARRAWTVATQAADLPHVPVWDRDAARSIAAKNQAVQP